MTERAIIDAASRESQRAAPGGRLRALTHAGELDATPAWARSRDDTTDPDDLDEGRAEEVARMLLAAPPPPTGADDVQGSRDLPDALRQWAERITGADLAGVRLRRTATDRAIVSRSGARAVTVGRDILLASEIESVSTGSGLQVLAHELGHVVHPPSGGKAGRLADPSASAWRAELAPEGLDAVRSWLPAVLDALSRVELGEDVLRGWDEAARQAGSPAASMRPEFVAIAAANGVAVLRPPDLRAVEFGPADRVKGARPATGTVEVVDLATGVSVHVGMAEAADGGVRSAVRAAGARQPNDEFRAGQSALVVHLPEFSLSERELGILHDEVRGEVIGTPEPQPEADAGPAASVDVQDSAIGAAADQQEPTDSAAQPEREAVEGASEVASGSVGGETGVGQESAPPTAEREPGAPSVERVSGALGAERESGAPSAEREQTMRSKRADARAARLAAAVRVPAWAATVDQGQGSSVAGDPTVEGETPATEPREAATGESAAGAGQAAGALGAGPAADAAETAPSSSEAVVAGAPAEQPVAGGSAPAVAEPAAEPGAGAGASDGSGGAVSDAAAEEHAERLDAAESGEAKAEDEPEGSPAAEDVDEAEAPEGSAADSGSEGPAEEPGAGDPGESAPGPADVAESAADEGPDTTPAVTEVKEAQRAAGDEHADSVRAAEPATDEREEERADEAIDAGDISGAESPPATDQGSLLTGLSEPVEGGGEGEGGAGSGVEAAGGGGDADPVPEPEPAPETSGMDPEAGLAAASELQPMQAAQALGGVGSAIDATAQAEGERLQSDLPVVEVGGDGSGGTAVKAPGDAGAEARVSAVDGGGRGRQQQPEPTPEPGPAPTAGIVAPAVADTAEGTVRREDAERVAGMVESMPTTDPSIDTSAGPAPALQKTGDADPANVREQRSELDTVVAEQAAQGKADVAAPAGEREVRDRSPRVAVEHPRIAQPGGKASGEVPADDEATGVIAEEKSGAGMRAELATAQGDMLAKRTEHREQASEEKAKSDTEIAALKEENAAQQQSEKSKVARDVGKARADWTAEQKAKVKDTDEKSKKEVQKGDDDIARAEEKGNKEAAAEIHKGEKEADTAKADAERSAAEKKREAERKKKEDSGGIFGWIASKVKSFFNALKEAVTKVFDAAKKLVKKAIEAAKKLAMAAIDRVRNAVIGLIKAVGAALIALGDVLLAAFPGLKKKWRAFIEKGVRAAEDAVNKLADALKKGVTKLLDALGKAFEFLLDTLKKGMLAALDAAQAAVMAAVNAAKAIADALGEWVAIIVDVARAPGRWVRNLAASAADGVRNHLWKAFVIAVKEWFNAKLEEVLGVGTAIWGVLTKGGLTLSAIGSMAFEALKAAIPPALIQLIIEKVVAMIVPAVGAVLAIIEGLQAAWGTVKRILAAFGKFLAFLKAVGKGPAGPQFAEMIAAAAIVVIDFVANWLLRRVRKPASKVAGKLKALAQKILARLKKALKKVGKAVKKAVRKIKGAIRKWKAKRQRRKDRKAGKDPKAEAAKRRKAKEEAKRKKREIAIRETRKALAGMLRKGVGGLYFRGQLLWLRTRYGWSSLQAKRRDRGAFEVVGRMSPGEVLASGDVGVDVQWKSEIADKFEISREQHANALQPPKRVLGEKGRNPWEEATDKFVRGPLLAQIAQQGGKSTEVGARPTADFDKNDPNATPEQKASSSKQRNARRRESTANRVNLKPQKVYRDAEGFKRKPDFEAIVKDPVRQDDGTSKVQVTQVNLIEQTVDVKITRQEASRKRIQIQDTIFRAADKYPTATIVYHIVAPVDCPSDVKNQLLDDLNKQPARKRIKLVWHAIKPPEG